jgi:hypothetical protein
MSRAPAQRPVGLIEKSEESGRCFLLPENSLLIQGKRVTGLADGQFAVLREVVLHVDNGVELNRLCLM